MTPARTRSASTRWPQPSGFTLVEMIAAFSILFVLAVTATQLLSSVTQVGVATNERRMTQTSVQRLADQIHDDRRGAASVDADIADDWNLAMATSIGRVAYRFDADDRSVRRTVTRDGSVINVDRYVMANDAAPTLEQTDDAIRLWLRRSATVTWMVEVPR